MDQSLAMEMGRDVVAALGEVEKKYGMKFAVGKYFYTDLTVDLTLAATTMVDGKAVRKEELHYRQYCRDLGFEDKHLGMTFTSIDGRTYVLSGMILGGRKYNLTARLNGTDEHWKFSSTFVRERLVAHGKW